MRWRWLACHKYLRSIWISIRPFCTKRKQTHLVSITSFCMNANNKSLRSD